MVRKNRAIWRNFDTKGSNVVDVGIDLKEFYLSVEWDILAVPAFRNEEYYTSQAEQQEGLEDHEPNDDGSEYKVR